jgi:hypothetical protein
MSSSPASQRDRSLLLEPRPGAAPSASPPTTLTNVELCFLHLGAARRSTPHPSSCFGSSWCLVSFASAPPQRRDEEPPRQPLNFPSQKRTIAGFRDPGFGFLFLCFLFTQEASQLFLILPIARVEAIIGRSASAGADPSCMRHHLLGSRVRGVGFVTRDLTCCLPVTFDVESAMPGRWPLGAGASSRRAAVSPLTPTPVRQGAGRHGTPTSSSS